MLQSVQSSDGSIRVKRESGFPSADEIRLTAFDATIEESVLRRLQVTFSYLGQETFTTRRDIARAATSSIRTWVFDEPEVIHTKRELATDPGMTLAEFASEYITLLGESCVLHRRIADVLSRPAAQGAPTYVRSIHDALHRSDRVALFDAALALYLTTYAHEQRRFAFGSSLKRMIERELDRYPSEWHSLLLTSTRGDFWSRYEQDLLDYVDQPTVSGRERLAALYFGADTTRLNSELSRVRGLPDEVMRDRRQSHRLQQSRLASQRVRKGYAQLGDFPRQQVRFSREANTNIVEIDRLLWVDNVLEKYIDHKQVLTHDLFLRLHVARLAIASALADGGSRILPRQLAIDTNDASQVLGVASSVSAPNMEQLMRTFGSEAIVFAVPDTRLAPRLLSIRNQMASRPTLLMGPWERAESAPIVHARVA